MNELPLPPASADQLLRDLFERLGESRVQELVGDLPESLVVRPSIQGPGSAIPVGDDVVHVSDEDGVVREVEEIGLLA